MNTCIIVVCATITIAIALHQDFIEEFIERVQEVGQACAEENHATQDDMAELVLGHIPPTTHEAKCMLFCMQRRLKTMKEDGTLDPSGAVIALKPLQKADPKMHQKVMQFLITCGMRVKPVRDPCETASLLAKCVKEAAEVMGLDAGELLAG